MAKRSLLLVDGDTRSLRVLEVSLKKAGFTVTTASDGAAALNIVGVSPPDLIISNTNLEGIDGFEFCRSVKNDPNLGTTPFVFLTDQTEIEHKIRGLELGVDEYLIKPIYIKEILTRVRILLQKADRNSLEGRNKPNTRFTGKLSDMGVVDLIQTVEVSGKSGVSHFSAPSGVVASIFFRDGRVIDAELGPLAGADAVYRLLTWNEGDFEVLFRPVRRRDVINLSPQALLMEGMRRLDEWGRLLEQLPPLSTRFEVAYAELAERLGELPDELNQLLRLFDGHRTLFDIVDQTPQGDLESLELIAKLYFEGLVVESEVPMPTGETWPPPVAERQAPIDLPPARVREAGPGELEHEPGDALSENVEINGPTPSAPREHRRAASLVDIAIGAVAPVYPGMDLSGPIAVATLAAAAAETADATAAAEELGDAADAVESAESAPESNGEQGLHVHPRPSRESDTHLAAVKPDRREIAMLPDLVERVRHQGDRREDSDRPARISSQPPPIPEAAKKRSSSAPPPIPDATTAGEDPANEPPAETQPQTDISDEEIPEIEPAEILPDEDVIEEPASAAAEPSEPVTEAVVDATDDRNDFVESENTPVAPIGDPNAYPAFDDEYTPTPAVLPDVLAPSSVASSEPSSPRVISSAGAEIVAVAGAISSLSAPGGRKALRQGSIVIDDEDLRDIEEPTVEEPLGQRARRSSPPVLEEPTEKRSPLTLYFAVAAAALILGVLFMLRRGPNNPSTDEQTADVGNDGGTSAAINPFLAAATADAGLKEGSRDAGPVAADAQVVIAADAADDVAQVTIDEPPTSRELARGFESKANRARSRGQMRDALGLINQAVSLRPTSRNMSTRADLLYALGRRKEAIFAANASLEMSPRQASAWRTKGLAHYENKEYAAAKTALGRYLELRPTGESSARIRTIYDRIDQ